MARLSIRTVLVGSLWGMCLITLYAFYPKQTYTGANGNDFNQSAPLSIERMGSKLEYLNDKLIEKNYELVRLKSQVQKLGKNSSLGFDSTAAITGYSRDIIILKKVPNLFLLMPHLEYNISSLSPQRKFGDIRRQVEMVLAIPHVRRSKKDYLEGTLRSLISQLSSEERDKVVVVVMVAEPFNSTEFDMVAKMVSQNFRQEVDNGILEVIQPPAKWYPNLNELPSKWGDSEERSKWRTKQNLDYSFMMLYCSFKATLYVQLEDDISAKPAYIKQMMQYAASQDRWELLEFSQLGFIGKMFRSAMLPKFVNFVLMFYQHKPVDWLLDNYFWVQECHGKICADLSRVRKRFRPSLFQHEGYHSSLDGKVQKLKDKDFNKKGPASQDPVVYAHQNPAAVLETSLKIYQQFTIERLYEGRSVFWALNSEPNDHITIRFKEVTRLKRYRVVSGDNQHKDDRLLNASISFLPVNQNSPHPPKSFILDNTGFVHFQYFNTSGRRSGDSSTRYSIAEGEVPPSFGSVTAVKIVNHIENQNWVIIDEIWLVT